jgi:hypothetical protein
MQRPILAMSMKNVRAACGRISEGIEYFDIAEKRETYELLELSLRLEVKDGCKLVHAECILGQKLLTIREPGTIVSTSQPMWCELQGDQFMMNTKVGRAKERNLRRDQFSKEQRLTLRMKIERVVEDL